MRIRFRAGVATSILAISAPGTATSAADASLTILEPSSHWQLDYGEERCRLARLFGNGDSKTIFWMEQTGPSGTFNWLVAGGAIDLLGSVRRVSASFGPAFESFELDESSSGPIRRDSLELASFGKAIESTGYRRFEHDSRGEPDEADQFGETYSELNPAHGAQIEYVEFSRKDRRVRLATGDLADGFKALNACATDLYEFWGVDPKEIARIATGVKPLNMKRVARQIQKHYPSKAERRGEDAIMQLKVLIGTDGRVEKCITIEKTKAENFDERACELFKQHAMFEPAQDAEGKPVRAFFSTTVVYAVF